MLARVNSEKGGLLRMYVNFRIRKPVLVVLVAVAFILVWLPLSYGTNMIFSSVSESADSVRLPILMYHSILKTNRSKGKFVITPDAFEGDLKYIKENGYTTIVMQDLIDYVYENKDLPEKPIMLTFDDGYYNNYLYAFPLLKEYECKMVLSPIGKQTDVYSENKDKNPNYAHCSWGELKEMQDSGLVEIQNHSYNMHTITRKRRGTKKNRSESFEHYQNALCSDIDLMQNRVADFLGTTPTTFVFPFGAVSKCSLDILHQMGFKATLSCEGKINKLTKTPEGLYGLYRILRPPNTSSEAFFKNKIEK